jgi:hypothetical protein
MLRCLRGWKLEFNLRKCIVSRVSVAFKEGSRLLIPSAFAVKVGGPTYKPTIRLQT